MIPNPLRDPRDRRIPRVAGPCVLVLFGVTGDLASKKLLPAIYDLANRGLLPPGFSLVGFARRDWEHEDFAQVTHDAVKAHARTPFREEVWQQLQEGMRFVPGRVRRRRRVRPAGRDRGRARRRARHRRQLRVLPVDAAQGVPAGGLAAQALRPGRPRSSRPAAARPWRRVVIEKPFGHDLDSARELNDLLSAVFPADSVFRIDHYLGKETVQNLLALRFANTLCEPIWNRGYVDHVQITMAEDIGIGGRAGYYDGIGAARDVIQNHLLQLLALTAMEEPVSFSAELAARGEGEGAVGGQDPRGPGRRHGPRPVRRGLAGRHRGARLPGGGGHPAGLHHRDLRRAAARHRHRRWAGRAVLPAHRQAAAAAG